MNALQLLKDNSKAALVIKQFYLDVLLEGLNDKNIPEDFKESVRNISIDDERIATLMDNSPRGMFDMFDSHKVFIGIIPIGNNGDFSVTINGDKLPTLFANRKEAESLAVETAIKLLNNKL